jgi:hypothetical protein
MQSQRRSQSRKVERRRRNWAFTFYHFLPATYAGIHVHGLPHTRLDAIASQLFGRNRELRLTVKRNSLVCGTFNTDLL